MKDTAIIVAGGQGKRMNSDIPKQFMSIQGIPILIYTLRVFYRFDPNLDIIVVLPENEISTWKALCDIHAFNLPHRIVKGGKTRFHSVKNAVDNLVYKGLVAIHDGVRPFVSLETIGRCFKTARNKGNAIPVIKPVDSIRIITKDGNYHLERDNARIIQTPQVFKAQILTDAYTQPYNETFTDDASVVESSGHKINLVEGNIENFKITTPVDLMTAEVYVQKLIQTEQS
jgi:2-C-methyl-D-erythritol 4-phosphate cytidylyltransferase